MEDKHSNDPKQEAQENDIGSDIIDGKSKPPDRENGSEVAEDQCKDRP